MPSLGNLVFGVVLVAVLGGMTAGGFVMLWKSVGRAERLVRFFAADETPIADIAPGQWVRIRGTVQTAEEGTAQTPLFGTEMVIAACRIERLGRHDGRNVPYWSTEHQLMAGTPFVLTDGTETVRVDPTDAAVEVDKSRTIHREYPSADAVPERVRGFVDRLALTEVPAGQNIRYTEHVVDPGDEVLIYGLVEDRNGTPVVTGDADAWSVVATKPVHKLAGRQLFAAGLALALGVILVSVPLIVVLWSLSWAGML